MTVALAAFSGLVIGAIAWLATRLAHRPVITGTEGMVGGLVDVVAHQPGHYVVRYGGELWNAQADMPLPSGTVARIVRMSGLVLWVEPLQGGKEDR